MSALERLRARLNVGLGFREVRDWSDQIGGIELDDLAKLLAVVDAAREYADFAEPLFKKWGERSPILEKIKKALTALDTP